MRLPWLLFVYLKKDLGPEPPSSRIPDTGITTDNLAVPETKSWTLTRLENANA